jgi:hypothetical protein
MTAVSEQRRAGKSLCGEPYHAIRTCRECGRLWKRNNRKPRQVVRRAMPHKAVGPPCPECGDTNSKSMQRGWSDPDDHFLRKRICQNCRVGFVTAEVVVPTEQTTFYRLDYRGREWRRENYRRRYAKTDLRLPIQNSDQLHVTIKVIPNPQLGRNICIRGHAFTPENTYLYPSGTRACRLCRRNRQRRYYLEGKAA